MKSKTYAAVIIVALLLVGCGGGLALPTETPMPTETPLPTETPMPTETPLPVTGKFMGVLINKDTGQPFENIPELTLMFSEDENVSKIPEGTIIPVKQTNDAGGKFVLEVTFPAGIDSVFSFASTVGCEMNDIFNMSKFGKLEGGQTVDVGEIQMSCK